MESIACASAQNDHYLFLTSTGRGWRWNSEPGGKGLTLVTPPASVIEPLIGQKLITVSHDEYGVFLMLDFEKSHMTADFKMDGVHADGTRWRGETSEDATLEHLGQFLGKTVCDVDSTADWLVIFFDNGATLRLMSDEPVIEQEAVHG